MADSVALARRLTIEAACRKLGVEVVPFLDALNAAKRPPSQKNLCLPLIGDENVVEDRAFCSSKG